MVKKLSNAFKNQLGFTLIELLITLSIIAVLSVLGLVIFTNVQRTSRDTQRKADIDSIASSMEQHFNQSPASGCTGGVTGQYCALAATFFSSGQIPTDPINTGTTCSTNACKYCVRSAAGACATGDTTVAAGAPAAAATYTVCTSLESTSGPGGQNYYCRSAQQ